MNDPVVPMPRLGELDVLQLYQMNPAACYAKHCQDVAEARGLRPNGKMRSAVVAHEERVKKAVEEDLAPLRRQAESLETMAGGNVGLVLDTLVQHAWENTGENIERRYTTIQRAKALRFLMENE